MSYWDDVGAVARAHREEILGDLDRARADHSMAVARADEAARRVATYEHLARLAGLDREADSPDMTLHEAMAEVLRDTPGGLRRATDLAYEINHRGLYQMRDGRPVEPQQIHARVNNYRHLFDKEGTFIKLAQGPA